MESGWARASFAGPSGSQRLYPVMFLLLGHPARLLYTFFVRLHAIWSIERLEWVSFEQWSTQVKARWTLRPHRPMDCGTQKEIETLISLVLQYVKACWILCGCCISHEYLHQEEAPGCHITWPVVRPCIHATRVQVMKQIAIAGSILKKTVKAIGTCWAYASVDKNTLWVDFFPGMNMVRGMSYVRCKKQERKADGDERACRETVKWYHSEPESEKWRN